MPQPRIMFYHDGRHPLIYMYEPPMRKEEYEAGVNELVGTPVEALMFCLGDGRTVLHDTKVGELWGHNVEKWPHLIFRRAHQNARDLIDEGHDPLRLICDRAHAKGMLVYPTLLVQQGRGDRSEDVRCSNFRFDNAHLEIGARGDVDTDFPGLTCLDFKHEEVREERFALIEETLNNYSVDGFELQLNYSPYYFHPDEVDAGREIMTAWIRRVYEAVKQSAGERELAIRIPASLEGCMQVGLDVRAWLQQGIVDVIIGQTFSGPELLDSTTDFRPLVAAAQGTNCRVHAAIQSHVDSDRLGEATIEMIRAAACNYWAQGVDGLYLAHWFGNWPYQASFYEKLRELPHPEIMAPKDKFYYVPTETGRYPKPVTEPGIAMTLPAALSVNNPTGMQFTISDDLPRWHGVGRVHEVLLRIRIMNTTEVDRMRFQLNGVDLPDSLRRKINEMYRMSAPRYRTGSGYWFIYRLDVKHWPQKGENTLQVTLLRREPDVIPQIYVRDVELEIKYLMGQNFHRGQDADLGPYDHSGL
ncbi:MAG: hypothetical protein O7E52_06045 [Candidatus Poribacteria bacterium]|nr:hypothetical protein [Candidatus Poribacteria bacterium]